MASRVIKTGSTGTEFATAPQPLAISDLDADLDAIFTNIDNTNIKTGAAIATAKLASDLGIVAGMIASLAVTTAKLADLAVTTAKINDLAVTIGKLALGAATSTGVNVAPPALTTSDTAEHDIAVLPSMVVRGGRVILFGTIAMRAALAASIGGGAGTITFRLYRGVTLLMTWVHTFGVTVSGGATVAWDFPLPTPAYTEFPGAGTYTYKLTGQSSAGVVQLIVPGANSGQFFAQEFA